MKKTLLALTVTALFGLKASAQEPYTLQVYDEAVYYGMYEGTVNEPLPANAIRHSNSSYGVKLTEEQLASFGNKLTMNVVVGALCDNYDRIANVNLAFVPKGATSYVYNEVSRIEIGRFITPFMNKNVTPDEVPYTWEVDNLTQIFHDPAITAEYDLWVELEIYGYQGAAVTEIPGCAGRNDVFRGSLEFVSSTNTALTTGENHFAPLSFKYELKNYTLDGTDVLGETTKSFTFTLDEPVADAKFYVITSNHGSNSGGEEYIRRNHFIYLDDVLSFMYKPGGISCEPFRQYNTQGNGIYGASPQSALQWASFSNWCPGAKIPTRVVELGDLEAGEHTFTIKVPDAVFADGQGYFPTSAYMQAYEVTLGTDTFDKKAFTVSPNPVNDIATITTNGQNVKTVSVVNTLGQTVLTGSTESVDLSALQSGIYMIKVDFTNNTSAVQKIVKR